MLHFFQLRSITKITILLHFTKYHYYSFIHTLCLRSSQYDCRTERKFSNNKNDSNTKPFTWEEVKDIVNNKKDLSLLTRSTIQEEKYAIYKNDINIHWKSIVDHILYSKFQFEKSEHIVKNENDIVWKAQPSLSEISTVQYALCLNEFPYNFEDDIEHWVLWKTLAKVTDEDICMAKKKLIQKKMDSNDDHTVVDDTIHWINPLQLKSIPEIEHCHIAIKLVSRI